MDVNVKGTLLCCQVVGGAMATAGRGSIVNVSSIYGLLSPVQSLYDFRRPGGERVRQTGRLLRLQVALVNLTRYLATYWAKSGVRVNTLTLAGVANDQPEAFVEAYAARSRSAAWPTSEACRRRRLPRVRRVLVRHRREPGRRRRLVGLVIPAEVAEPHRRRGAAARDGAWLEKTRPADGAALCRVARSGAGRRGAAVAAARRSAGWNGPSARPSSAATSCGRSPRAARAARGAERVVVAETGKSIEFARGETDAAVEMGFFVAGEGRRSYGRTMTATMAHRTVLTLRQPGRRRGALISFNTPLPNVAWKAFPRSSAATRPSSSRPSTPRRRPRVRQPLPRGRLAAPAC